MSKSERHQRAADARWSRRTIEQRREALRHVREARGTMAKVKGEVQDEIAELRAEFETWKGQIAQLRAELEQTREQTAA